MTLREQVQDRIILMMTADWGGTDKEAVDDILKLFEKLIDEVKQEQINYVTCSDHGTEEIANILNDIATQSYWDGVKETINKLKEELKK